MFAAWTLAGFATGCIISLAVVFMQQSDGVPGDGILIVAIIGLSSFVGTAGGLANANDVLIGKRSQTN